MADEQPNGNPSGSTPEDSQLIDLGDGNKVTLEEVRKGYLRQSDYTKKTQELAETRKKLEQAAELGNYILNDPALLAKLQSDDPEVEPESESRPKSRSGSRNQEDSEETELARKWIESVENRMSSLSQDKADQELEMALEKIGDKFQMDNSEIDELVALADEMEVDSVKGLEKLAQMMRAEKSLPKVREQVERELLQRIQSEPDFLSHRISAMRKAEPQSQFQKELAAAEQEIANNNIWNKLGLKP